MMLSNRALTRSVPQMATLKERLRLAQLYDFAGSFRSAFRGVYSSFDEARLAAPKSLKVGHDHVENAQTHRGYVHKLRFSDYAVLFWMQQILGDNSTVFDLGGHIGVSYYGFAKYLKFSPNLRWTVCDVPQVVKAGREYAESRQDTQISFTSDFAAADGQEVLLTAGALQCIETPLASILAPLAQKPKHLLINRTPLFDGPEFFTLQKIGGLINPYHIFSRKAFLESLEALGYRLVDAWEVTETYCGTCVIPFHPDKTVHPYSGLYLRRDA